MGIKFQIPSIQQLLALALPLFLFGIAFLTLSQVIITSDLPDTKYYDPFDFSELPKELKKTLGTNAITKIEKTYSIKGYNLTQINVLAGDKYRETYLQEAHQLLPSKLFDYVDPLWITELAQEFENAIHDEKGILLPFNTTRIVQSALDEINLLSPLITQQPLQSPLLKIVITGQSHAMVDFNLSPDEIANREISWFKAWSDLIVENYKEKGIPIFEYKTFLSNGKTKLHQGQLSKALGLQSWYDETAYSFPEEEDYYAEYGRIIAYHVLGKARLAEVVFIGHGRDLINQRVKFEPFKIGKTIIGDEFLEVSSLQSDDKQTRIRMGITFSQDDSFLSFSCSNLRSGQVSPELNTASIGWFINTGDFAPLKTLSSYTWNISKSINEGILDKRDHYDNMKQVTQSMSPVQKTGINSIYTINPGVFALRGMDRPYLLIFTSGYTLNDDLNKRIKAATTVYRVISSRNNSGSIPISPCQINSQCQKNLNRLINGERTILFGNNSYEVVEEHNYSNKQIRVALVKNTDENLESLLDRAKEIQKKLRSHRIQGIILLDEQWNEINL